MVDFYMTMRILNNLAIQKEPFIKGQLSINFFYKKNCWTSFNFNELRRFEFIGIPIWTGCLLLYSNVVNLHMFNYHKRFLFMAEESFRVSCTYNLLRCNFKYLLASCESSGMYCGSQINCQAYRLLTQKLLVKKQVRGPCVINAYTCILTNKNCYSISIALATIITTIINYIQSITMWIMIN